MQNYRPVSDLRNYMELLQTIAVDSPVLLTQNGKERYALLDFDEYEKLRAAIRLFAELAKGEASAREEGWLSADEVEAALGVHA